MRRGIDWGICVVLLLSVLVGSAFLRYEGIPRHSETLLYQTHTLLSAFREGTLYPRWSPHVLLGYGAPIPQFTPPAPAYSLALLDLLFVGDLAQSLRIGFVLVFLALGAATYSFVLRHSNAHAALVAAVMTLTAPYISLTLPFIRADYSQLMGLALLMGTLWSVDKWLYQHTRLTWWLSLASSSALILTSPTFYAPLAALLSTVLASYHAYQQNQRRLLWWWLVLTAHSVAVTAFFWLPAYAEQEGVLWQAYYTLNPHPVTLTQLLEPAQALRASIAVMPPQFALGTAHVLVVVLATFTLLARRARPQFITGLGALLMGISTLALLVDADAHAWVGVLSLALAFVSTALFVRVDTSVQRAIFVITVSSVLIGSLPIWLSTPKLEGYAPPTPLTAIRHEQQGFGVLGVPLDAPVPSTYQPDNALVGGYQANAPNRLIVQSVLTNQISILSQTSQSYRYQVRIRQPLEMQFLVAPFVGWTAKLNDFVLPLEQRSQRGYQLNVPPISNGTLTLALVSTPLRTLAWGTSGISLLSVLLFSAWLGAHKHVRPLLRLRLLDAHSVRLLGLLLLLFVAFVGTFLLGALPNPDPTRSNLQPIVRSDSGLALVRYYASSERTLFGRMLTVYTQWNVLRPPGENYFIRISLRDVASSAPAWESSTMLLGNLPSKRWQRGDIVQERHTLPLPLDLPNGRYVVTLRLLICLPYMQVCPDGSSVQFFDAQGQARGRTLTLPMLLVLD